LSQSKITRAKGKFNSDSMGTGTINADNLIRIINRTNPATEKIVFDLKISNKINLD
jgi:hypothetical protein